MLMEIYSSSSWVVTLNGPRLKRPRANNHQTTGENLQEILIEKKLQLAMLLAKYK